MHDNFRCEREENMLEQIQRESEACPVVSILQDLQAIAIYVNFTIEELGIECLVRDLGMSAILGLVLGILKCEVVLNWAAWELDLLVLARTERGCQIPETDQDGDGCEKTKEYAGLQSTTDFPREVCRHTSNQAKEGEVGEASVSSSVGGERGILDGRILSQKVSRCLIGVRRRRDIDQMPLGHYEKMRHQD